MSHRTVFLVLLSLFIPSAATSASIFVPGGLSPGDTYHLAFVTRGIRDGTSSDIADYNTFVRDQAVLPGALTEDFGIDWFAIASTSSDAARVNAPATAGVFLLDGTLINPSANLYFGSLLDAALTRDQYNTAVPEGWAWTGSTRNGDVRTGLGLGDPNNFGDANVGSIYATGTGFLDSQSLLQGDLYRLFALSEELTVPQPAVPEPASGLVWLLLVGGSLSLTYCRHCRKTRPDSHSLLNLPATT